MLRARKAKFDDGIFFSYAKAGNLYSKKNTRSLYWHLYLSLFAWLLSFFFIFFLVSSDTKQGVAQRIFYFHVPSAWISFISLSICFYFSIQYLRKAKRNDDIKAFSYAKIGWLFTTGVLITGPLWAKPIWGVYWNWSDQRLITFFILWLIFSTYFLLRKNIQDIHKSARLSAVIAILGFLDIPLVYFSIRIWNTPSHPGPIMGDGASSMSLEPEMRFTLWYSFFCFLIFMFLIARLQIRSLQIKYHIYEKRENMR